jgi:hypothetical protein
MGIGGIFVVDPEQERTFRFEGGNLLQCSGTVALSGTQAVVDWTGIAAARDLD